MPWYYYAVGIVLLVVSMCYVVWWKWHNQDVEMEVSSEEPVAPAKPAPRKKSAEELLYERCMSRANELKARLESELVLRTDKFYVDVYANFLNPPLVDIHVTSGACIFGTRMFDIKIDYSDFQNPRYVMKEYRGHYGITCKHNEIDVLIQRAQVFVSLWEKQDSPEIKQLEAV